MGKAFATYLSKSPYRLVATARTISALDYLQDTPNIHKLTLDIVSPSAIQEAVSRTLDVFGRIDIVINNVGYSLIGDTETTTDEQARLQFETNFWGATNLTREAVRVMREENPKTGQIGGVVIYTSAASARVAFPGGSYYYAT
jgi:NAD(P)-dependent dehydrogenase (short-subunit alcohol dehydrogenase family)